MQSQSQLGLVGLPICLTEHYFTGWFSTIRGVGITTTFDKIRPRLMSNLTFWICQNSRSAVVFYTLACFRHAKCLTFYVAASVSLHLTSLSHFSTREKACVHSKLVNAQCSRWVADVETRDSPHKQPLYSHA